MLFEKLFAHDITSVKPRIVDLEEPIQIVGMRINTNIKGIYRDVPALGKQFEQYKSSHEIPNRKIPWGFAAVSKGFEVDKGAFSYFIGDSVTKIEDVPAGLTFFKIPCLKYAVFPTRPKNRFGWSIAIASAKRYIYNIWLPNPNMNQPV